MNSAVLLQHFERISEAPDAVPRLRRFVLDLAVRGKLVEQDPKDEPAVELLKRIGAQKKARVGRRSMEDSEEEFGECEAPFAIPESWEWVRATEPAATISDNGKKVQTKDVLASGAYPVVDQGKIFIRGYCDDATKVIHVKTPIIAFGDHTREMKLIDFDFVVGADGVKLLEPIGIVPSYYFLALQWLPLDSRGYGRHFKVLRASLIPLPPVAEQHRIVVKVDELMALCDRLETAQAERESRRDRLAAASLHRLNNGADREAFREHARFHLRHLPRLTTRPEHVQELRQTILNLAVRGRLVPHDTNDEPATELFKRIQEEKARLVKEGKIKAEKSSLPVTEIPDDIPDRWVLCRWNNIAMKIGDIDHKMPDTVSDGVPYVSPRDFYPNNGINFDGAKRISRDDYLRLAAKIKPDAGDLIYPRYGTIGENRLVIEQKDFLASYSCAVVKVLRGFIDPKYQYLFSISDFCKEQAKEAENKTTQANVGISSIRQFLVPLPPLAEQHRIVAKVDELMALCDRLEAQLATAQTKSRRLLDASLDDALSGNGEILQEVLQT